MIRRPKYLDKIARAFSSVPIATLIGARQVGKTSIMKVYSDEQPGEKVFLNGQDPDVAARFEHLGTIEQYLKNYIGAELDGLLLIDEFQYIQGISTMLKLMTDKYPKLKILCSGSSSLDILQHIEESLAGRVRVIEVLSLSFEEYLLFKDAKLYSLYESLADGRDKALCSDIQRAYSEYLVYGGFPRVSLNGSYEEKAELLNDIYQTYLLNDVRHYVANEHFVGFNKLLRLLAAQIGNLVNINELSKSSGLNYGMCEKYLLLLQKMFIIRLVEPYSTNRRKVISKMSKVYFYDLGLRNMIYNSFNEIEFRSDNGALFENEVMLELWRSRKANETLNFYRTQGGVEVDFILNGPTRRVIVECKYKHLDRPISIASLQNVADEEDIPQRIIANINLDAEHKGTRLCPGFMIVKLV